MRDPIIISFIFFALFTSSCSTVNLSARKGKDLSLNSNDYLKLKGTYSNLALDTNRATFKRTLFENFTLDTLGRSQTGFYSELIPIDNKTLTVNFYKHNKLYAKDELVKSVTLKGKFKDGYFKIKRKYPVRFIAGPLLWVLGERQSYVGLTNDNNIVILDSRGKGVLFFIVLPFFVAGGDKHDYEYTRNK
ncbi:MAG: hypothetical protein JWO09_176 [Bacteroidetes bacterium]|nr:hypothetical protein [Bacteroidota bacterium]